MWKRVGFNAKAEGESACREMSCVGDTGGGKASAEERNR